jgi:ribonucleases P/MRP protein subunit RPP40
MKHHPFEHMVKPTVTRFDNTMIPALPPETKVESEDAEEILEWISLQMLGSPRVQADDKIDDYLCRYQLSQAQQGHETAVVMLQWRGFAAPSFSVNLYRALQNLPEWAAMSVSSLDKRSCTILRIEDHDVLYWVCSN